MKTVAIVGGTGYTGLELVRLIVTHPGFALTMVTSRGEVGIGLADYFPNLRGAVDLVFSAPDPELLGQCDLVFFATPNGTAMEMAPTLVEQGCRIIDLAADFRLPDVAEWQSWYGMPHTCPELLAEAVYGLPEFNRAAISKARIIANPGCYPTAVLLGLLPLLEADLVEQQSLIADTKSGISGAGRNLSIGSLYGEVSENFKAYNVPGHRHRAEISVYLQAFGGGTSDLLFVPHLTPMIRGIHATLYATLSACEVDLQACFEARYSSERFVDVLPPGSHPETGSVRGSNLCRLAVHRPRDGARVVVLSVIDNLVKGAAGQAVQNANLMFGFDEGWGIDQIAVAP